MTASNPADDFLGAGNPPAPTFKFEQVGDTVTGVVLERSLQQQREFTGKPGVLGEPLTWPDGEPKMQAVLTVQADEVELTDEDDGRRRIFVKGKNMTDAFRDAIRRISLRGSVVGCRIGVSFVGFGEPSGSGSPPKLYEVKVAAPAARATETPTEAPLGDGLDEFSEEPF